MIKVKLTKNYTGFNIEGTFDDFYKLYENIYSILGYEQCKDLTEEDMRLHILGFLYDLRHAYQGDRYIYTKDNRLCDYHKEIYGIGKSVKKDVMYAFDYVVPELILDILLFKYFALKNKNISKYDSRYNMVMFFYSLVIESLGEILDNDKVNEIKALLDDTFMDETIFFKQWFMKIAIDYIHMSPMKKKCEIEKIINSICNYTNNSTFKKIKKEVIACAKENNCHISHIEYGEYPENIKW